MCQSVSFFDSLVFYKYKPVCVRHVYFILLAISDFLSVKDQMYADIIADNPCFLRLNGTDRFGCTCKFFLNVYEYTSVVCKLLIFYFLASRFGNVGTLHIVTNSSDLDWLMNEGEANPYTVALTPKMFNR